MSEVSCINYDFGKNWDKIVLYLHTPEMEKLKRKAFYEIKNNHDYPQNWRYNKKKSIADLFTSNDAYATMKETMLDSFIEKKDKRIPEALLQKYHTSWKKIMDSDKAFQKALNIKYKLGDYVDCNYATSPNHMVHFVAFSSCHWFNKHIGMYWAKLICPEIKWKLLQACYHTTIISDDGKHMFDLLAYAWGRDRFKAYCCNEEYVETDLSLGAKQSMEMVMKEDK